MLTERLAKLPFVGLKPMREPENKRSDIIEPVERVQGLLEVCRRGAQRLESKNGRGFGLVGAPEWLYPSVLISVYTGMRVQELALLDGADVDFERRKRCRIPGVTITLASMGPLRLEFGVTPNAFQPVLTA